MATLDFFQKSMNVTVTEFTHNVIQHDIAMFQINNNKLLNTIVQNLSGESSADYLYQHESYQSLIEKIIDACAKEFKANPHKANAARAKIENLYKEQFYAEKNQPIHGKSLRFTLYKQSVELLYYVPGIPKDTLIGYPDSDNKEPRYKSVTKYLGRLFESYAKLDPKDREKCIYANTYQTIRNAIAEKKNITANTNSCVKLIIKPYAILSDVYTGYYYLVAYAREESDEAFEVSTFRLSRLHNSKMYRGNCLSDTEIYALQEKLKEVSPAYLRNDADEIQVMMTKAGEEKYLRILHNRPEIKSKEPIISPENNYSAKYTFYCTKFQIANYFHQFGADAVITEPRELHDEQKMWYDNALKAYE